MLKDSSSVVPKTNSNNDSIQNQLSYNQLLNMRTTLLHMQYLYSSLENSLSKQHYNQQNQHKDHLIQCYNIRQELEEVKGNNFMKLFIVKLEELLSIQEDNNNRLIRQSEQSGIEKQYYEHHQWRQQQQQQQNAGQQYQQLKKEYAITSMIDKLLTFVQIKQQQMQHSLCKLYLGNKVMLDLQKTSKSIQCIENKVDEFMGKNGDIIELYNERLEELREMKESCAGYMRVVENGVLQLVKGQQQSIKMSDNNKGNKYEQHIRNKLNQQQQLIELRINSLKSKLLQFD